MNRTGIQIAVAIAVFGTFIAVAVFSEQLGEALAGVLILVVGALAIIFREHLTALQHRLVEVGWAPERWREIRPFTYLLWGIGLLIVGASWIWFAYAHV